MLRTGKVGYYDWISIGIFLSLLIVGWLAIYSVTYAESAHTDFLDASVPITRQTIYILIALLLFLITQFISEKFWHTFAYLIYGLGLFLLFLVLIFGTETKGAKAWFSFGGFSFQPVEIAKFGTALALSSFMSYYKTNLRKINYQLISFGIILAPILLILLQPDAGSALVFLSFFIMLFIEGLNEAYYLIALLLIAVFICALIFPLAYILAGLLIVGIAVSWYYAKKFKYQNIAFLFMVSSILAAGYFLTTEQLVWACCGVFAISLLYLWKSREERLSIVLPISIVILSLFAYSGLTFFNGLEPHQQERIKVWLKPEECDPRGSLYNILQSKVAIGAGGFSGKGLLNGNMTKLKFVPEQSTDFIFSSIGEEHGFIGTLTVILLFFALIYRIIRMSEQSERKFFSCFALCIAGLMFFHVVINIGMTMGLVPIIGIPLPFISKGGSALIGFSIMLGVLLKMQKMS